MPLVKQIGPKARFYTDHCLFLQCDSSATDMHSRTLCRLQDLSGGNEAKLSFLASLQTVKLVGRADSRLSQSEVQILQAIVEQRKGAEPPPASLVASPSPPLRQPPYSSVSKQLNGHSDRDTVSDSIASLARLKQTSPKPHATFRVAASTHALPQEY